MNCETWQFNSRHLRIKDEILSYPFLFLASSIFFAVSTLKYLTLAFCHSLDCCCCLQRDGGNEGHRGRTPPLPVLEDQFTLFQSKWLKCPKHSLKMRTVSAIFWIYLGIFRDYSLNFFFKNESFCVFQDRKLKLSASVKNRIS